MDFINATRWIREHCPHASISGGVSNVSFSFRGNNEVREAIHSVFLWAIPLLLVGFALSWFLDEIPLRETVDAGSLSPGSTPQPSVPVA